jgi:hypothetical protein
MRNGVVIDPPHDFKQPSPYYYKVWKHKMCDSGEFTYGIISIPNFMNFRPASLLLLNAYGRMDGSDLVELG